MSDIHGNLEALTAIMQDATTRGVEKFAFLGDAMGYGGSPREVLSIIRRFDLCIQGNHDLAVVEGPPRNFNPTARSAIRAHHNAISPDSMGVKKMLNKQEFQQRQALWRFLAKAPVSSQSDKYYFVHDTPLAPGSAGYIMKPEQAKEAFEKNTAFNTCFIGHSHVPRIFTHDERITPEQGKRYKISGRQIINVGSVGQPRDKDPRACYVIVHDDNSFRYHRVEYDIASAQKKILQAGLHKSLAERLARGN